MKLTPRPSECACTRPGCEPLVDPATVKDPMSSGEPPRTLIWVLGDATLDPGDGKIRTDDGLDDARVVQPAATSISTTATAALRTNDVLLNGATLDVMDANRTKPDVQMLNAPASWTPL
ncbi:MAG TPA: hypothetical protein VGB64_13215, partial [Actinomycetota bacterium]